MGKGDTRRPTLVKEEQFTNEWCATFGHRMRADAEWCVNCGRSGQEIAEHGMESGRREA